LKLFVNRRERRREGRGKGAHRDYNPQLRGRERLRKKGKTISTTLQKERSSRKPDIEGKRESYSFEKGKNKKRTALRWKRYRKKEGRREK